MDNSKSRIAAKIREAREWKEITQVGMAKTLGIARQTYLDLESGKTEPRISTLVEIAQLTGRPLTWFVFDDEEKVMGDEHSEIQELLNLFGQVPSQFRSQLIKHNKEFISCWLDYITALKRR